jgi:hypothetical protein
LTLVHDRHGLDGDLIRTLARSPRKARLERLRLFDSHLTPELIRRDRGPLLGRVAEVGGALSGGRAAGFLASSHGRIPFVIRRRNR